MSGAMAGSGRAQPAGTGKPLAGGSAAGPRVAFQGEPGAFSEEAVRAVFGAAAVPLPRREFRGVGAAVLDGSADAGLLPVENSVAGSVVGAYDVLAAGGLEVSAEIVLPIRHFLLAPAGASLGTVRRVHSHPVALAQCTRFLAGYPSIEAIAVHDTAGAAREVAAAGDPTRAAIAGRRAAELYGLRVIASDLQDRADNQTRFVAVIRRGTRDDAGLSESDAGARAAWKTMLAAETPDRPGALLELLRPFAERGVNLTKLESRPGEQPWTYRFFLELEGDAASEPVRAAVEGARRAAASVVVLGSFPRVSVGGAAPVA